MFCVLLSSGKYASSCLEKCAKIFQVWKPECAQTCSETQPV
jgi:hypothetical protein